MKTGSGNFWSMVPGPEQQLPGACEEKQDPEKLSEQRQGQYGAKKGKDCGSSAASSDGREEGAQMQPSLLPAEAAGGKGTGQKEKKIDTPGSFRIHAQYHRQP